MISSEDLIFASFLRLKEFCEKENFKGWDPFDGLNSKIFSKVPILYNNRTARLLWIQFFKRSSLNFRKMLKVEKGYNPKGLGLFLNGYCNLYRVRPDVDVLNQIHFLANKLIVLQTKGYSGSCWGYNFDWQARAFYQPKFTPTVVATSFIASALFDAYEVTGEILYLETAISSGDFILKDLNRTYGKGGTFCFSYSPKDRSQVFNASLLGSKLLGRIYTYTQDKNILEDAMLSINYCCEAQNEDGSWSYGNLPFHQWIDNFHTGFNLEALCSFQRYTGIFDFDVNIEKGLNYYLNTFFTDEGVPKYFNNKTYPVDIHSSAQLIMTLASAGKFDEKIQIVKKVLKWTIGNMQDKQGFFYYQFRKSFTNKIPYMRWAQSWMFYAMSVYFLNCESSSGSSLTKEVMDKVRLFAN